LALFNLLNHNRHKYQFLNFLKNKALLKDFLTIIKKLKSMKTIFYRYKIKLYIVT